MSKLRFSCLARVSSGSLLFVSSLLGCSAGAGSDSIAGEGAEETVEEASSALLLASNTDSIASGTSLHCALLEGGIVKCWGRNESGQLGQGDGTSRGSTVASMGNGLGSINFGAGRTAKQLRVGSSHACAILDNNQLKCWGANANGQLGTGDALSRGTSPSQLGDNLPPVDLGTRRTAKAVALGTRHTCALLDTNQIKCWGHNLSGQLGVGDNVFRINSGSLGDNLPTVNLGTGRSAKAVAASGDFTCAILDTNQVKCWGVNTAGALGVGHSMSLGTDPAQMGDALPAVDLGTGRTATAIALGQFFACALLDNAQVKCWGSGSSGQSGQGSTQAIGDQPMEMGDLLPPIDLGTGRTALAISAESSTVCAVLDSGQVKCWGSNSQGQLGLGDVNNRGDAPDEMGDQLAPVLLGTGNTATAVSVGATSVCATLQSRRVKCWGGNGDGSLGIGSTEAARGDAAGEMGSALVYVNLGAKGVKAVSTGDDFTCALHGDGKVKCWGGNANGQLGLGDRTVRGDGAGEMGAALPALTLGLASPIKQLTSRVSSSCVVTTAGELKCWGSNASGELGLGHRNNIGDDPTETGAGMLPVSLGTGVTVKSVAIGEAFACAITNDDRVKCWGKNARGQLGLGDVQNRGDDAAEMGNSLPFVNVGTGRTVKKLALGLDHVCALLDNNLVKCWGNNGGAMLGIGDVTDRGDGPGEMGDALAYAQLGTGRTAKDIIAGAHHSCALLDNNQLKCWGYNGNGATGAGDQNRLGDAPGEMGDALPYVALGADRSVKSISSMVYGTCAVLDNDLVKCWGRNSFEGMLGIGDIRDRGIHPGEMGDALPTVFLGAGRTVTSVSGSAYHNCAILTTGELKCWGRNHMGQLGLGDTLDRGNDIAEASSGYFAVDLGAE